MRLTSGHFFEEKEATHAGNFPSVQRGRYSLVLHTATRILEGAQREGTQVNRKKEKERGAPVPVVRNLSSSLVGITKTQIVFLTISLSTKTRKTN